MQPKKVLVPISGAKADEEAIRLSCRLAKKAGGKIYVTYVIQVDRSLPLDAEVKPEIDKAEQVLDQAECIAEEQDYNVETDLLQSREIGPAIVDEAIERGVDLITIGQYIAPSREHYPVKEYVHPNTFQYYKDLGIELGFRMIESGPLVRSSYHAEKARIFLEKG